MLCNIFISTKFYFDDIIFIRSVHTLTYFNFNSIETLIINTIKQQYASSVDSYNIVRSVKNH